jgi:hypothetical protein
MKKNYSPFVATGLEAFCSHLVSDEGINDVRKRTDIAVQDLADGIREHKKRIMGIQSHTSELGIFGQLKLGKEDKSTKFGKDKLFGRFFALQVRMSVETVVTYS